jgi:7-carboxy-7-deazaguanine synthase
MLPVIEKFYSIQGEGVFAGIPSVFVRVSGCNLRCVFKGSICDTSYTSFHPTKSQYTSNDDIVNDIVDIMKENNAEHLVITGGEPLLYQDDLIHVLQWVMNYLPDITVTIETNGSIVPEIKLTNMVDLFSVSPKLSTSVDNDGKVLKPEQVDRHNRTRINLDALATFTTSSYFYFKYVYSGPECIQEINDLHQQIIDKIINEQNRNPEVYNMDLMNARTILMPEGSNQEQLNNSRLGCVEAALKQGWRFTDRLHITIWNDKKEV